MRTIPTATTKGLEMRKSSKFKDSKQTDKAVKKVGKGTIGERQPMELIDDYWLKLNEKKRAAEEKDIGTPIRLNPLDKLNDKEKIILSREVNRKLKMENRIDEIKEVNITPSQAT